MADLTFAEIVAMQCAFQERHADEWPPMTPEHGRSSLLWMIEEVGEVAAIIKKKGDAAIMDSPAVRAAFVEELADVLMYFGDMMLCYGLTGEELGAAYRAKYARNIGRDYNSEYSKLLPDA